MFLLDFTGSHNLTGTTKTGNWFEDALEIDVYAGSKFPKVKELTDDLFKEILKRKTIYNKARSKETLKMILLNLWVSYHCDKPINYSRSPNNYSHPKRYGKLRFKYDRVIPIIDTLDKMGFLEQVKGFYDRDKDLGRQTRMYATHDLIKMFNDAIPTSFDVVERLPRREIIQLKDEDKRLLDYEDSDHTENMRKNLHEYNQFIKNQTIDFEIPLDLPLKWKQLNTIRHNLLKGIIGINQLAEEHPSRILFKDHIDSNKYNINPSIIHSTNTNSKYYNHTTNPIYNSTTNNHDYYSITTMTNKVSDIVKDSSSLEYKNTLFRLCDFGIIFLDCQLKFELLHRVFSNRSFDQGGRFFGAGHLQLPKKVRKHHIAINGSPTVELDFSAMHIRMLYHEEGIPYTDDPYAILCDSEEERKIYNLNFARKSPL